MKNEDLGYNLFFETGRNRLLPDNFSVARVTAEHKGAYNVIGEQGRFLAKITGRQMFKAGSREDYPAVGDWVAITKLNEGHAVINGVLPRQTIIKRKFGDKNKDGEKDGVQIIAANIDVVFAVESADRDYNLNRLERYFAIAENGGAEPAIILNKADLLSKEESDEKLFQLKNRFPGANIIFTSTVSSEGLSELKSYITKGKTYCFLGSSGVGKSSIINELLGKSAIKTGGISSASGRGRHITTGRQMYFLENGGIVIDNPGTREVGMADAGRGIDIFFGEIEVLAQKCRYADCTHTHEPDCEVIKAVNSGKLDKEKYSNYASLKKKPNITG